MVKERKPIQVSEAVRRVIKGITPLGTESIAIEKCDDRILAEDVKADHDVPPFDRSPYDGFAVRAEDTVTATENQPVEFEVIEEIGAGEVAHQAIQKRQAIRIMTGASLPSGADAIIMLEHVDEIGRNGKPYIAVKTRLDSGQNISKQGEDTKKGNIQMEKGEVITPGAKAVLATFGYANVDVYRKPVVGIYATGTELLDVDEALVPGKIRNSNAYTTSSQVKNVGAVPRYFGQLKDDFESCFQAVQQALDEVDVLITTGGVSVGDYDYLPAIYEKLGAEVLFNKVAMRPGSVTTVAEREGKLLFGLSGNPSACFVGFELFARPALKKVLGANRPYLQAAKAVIDKDLPKRNPFTKFVRSTVDFKNEKLSVRPTGLDKSNVVTSLADANAFMVLPGGEEGGFSKGSVVDILLLGQTGESWEIT
jgi:molybdopterin molybdotransferase